MRDAVRSFCADRFDLTRVAEREGAAVDDPTWSSLVDMGVVGMLAADSGFGLVEAAVVFEELGAHLAGGPVLWSVLAAPLVAGVADGEVRVTASTSARRSTARSWSSTAPRATCSSCCGTTGPSWSGSPMSSAPRSAGRSTRSTPTTILPSLPTGAVLLEGAAVDELRRSGRVLTSAFLVGAAQAVLDVARDYALGREQFGVPIGYVPGRQAHDGRHVRAGRDGSEPPPTRRRRWRTASDGGDAERPASAAKHLAGEACDLNSRAAVQVLGGMGFTWDMPRTTS